MARPEFAETQDPGYRLTALDVLVGPILAERIDQALIERSLQLLEFAAAKIAAPSLPIAQRDAAIAKEPCAGASSGR